MFRILCDPSSGSTELCLTEITRGDSQILSCAWSVFGSVILNLWCVCVRYGRPGTSSKHTPQVQNYEPVVCVCTVRPAGN
jgi:hypothetical protein